jgi:hypothetical protein
MRSTSKARSRQRSRARWFSMDRYRALGACAALAGILTFANMGGYLPAPQFLSAPQVASGDTRYVTGTIILVPTEGNVCQRRVIENATWRIHDKGYVDCDSALSANPVSIADSRMAVIRDGFRNK